MEFEERHPLCNTMRARVLAELERDVPTLLRTQEDSRRLDRYLRDTVGRYT